MAFIGRVDLSIGLFQNEQATTITEARQTGETNLRIGGINRFAIQVDDIDQAVSELEAKGVAVVAPPREVPNGGGDRLAFVHDNERMLVELFQAA